MKKITVSILTTLLMLSMVFSSSVFAAEKEQSAWESFLGLFSAKTAATSDVGVEYRGHIQNVGNYPLDGSWIQGPTQLGTVGQSLRLEGFWIQLTNKPADVNIQYQVHVQNEGWMNPVTNGAFAGTEGKSQQIEAIKISLVDNNGNPVSGYSVEYRGHVQNIGDTAWYKDGAQLGTDGQFLRLEALEVKIVQTKADMTAYNAAVAEATALTEADYTAASWAALETALIDNLVTEDNTQAEVDAATAAINDAIDALVKVTTIDLTATGVKELTVTFNQAVADTDSAVFAVLKGTSTTIGVSDVAWNDDKTVATLTLASRLGEGTYTVNVTGVVEGTTLTDSVTTEAETVTTINITSDKAILQAADTKKVVVGYEVLNQYGEDVTSKYADSDFTSNSNKGDVSLDKDTALATITNTVAFEEDQSVTLTIVHDDTAVSTTKKLTVSAVAGVASLALGDVYNMDDEALSADNIGSTFYMVVEAKDQYGNAVDADFLNTANIVVVTTNDDTVLSLNAGDKFVEKDVTGDGVKETCLVLTVEGAGDAKINVISLYDGTKASKTLTVAEATVLDTISFTQPDLVVLGEKVVVPFEAIDINGDEMTSAADLNNTTTGVATKQFANGTGLTGTATGLFKKNATTGVVEFVLDLENVSNTGDYEGGTITMVVTTANGETTTVKFTAKAAATPTQITGLVAGTNLNPTLDGYVEIDGDDIIIIDQYERVMDNDDIAATNIVMTLDDEEIASFNSADSGTATKTIALNSTADIYGNAKGMTDLEFAIQNVDDSEYTTTVRVATTSEFSSYTASSVATVFDEFANVVVTDMQGQQLDQVYTRPIKVYGVLSNGTQVLLPADKYTVRFIGKTGLGATADTNQWLLDVVDEGVTYATDATETTATAIVTINATGEELTQTVTISKVDPIVKTLAFTSAVVNGGYDISATTFNAGTAALVLDADNSYDSYGEEIASFSSAGATFKNNLTEGMVINIADVVDSNDSITITNNGKNNAIVSGITSDDSFKVTVKFNNGATKFFGVSANAVTDATATVGDVTVTGVVDEEITDTDATITLSDDTFKTAIAAETDVAAWITNLPTGLTAEIKSAVPAGSTTAVVTIAGTPTAASGDALAITVPAASLTAGADITATTNASAKYAIQPAAPTLTINNPAADGLTYDINSDATMEFSINGTDWTPGTAGQDTVTIPTAGATVSMRVKASGSVPAGVAATKVYAVQETAPVGVANGDLQLTGTTTAMEYSDDNGLTWADCTDTNTSVSAGTYIVRFAATDTVIASAATGDIVVVDEP